MHRALLLLDKLIGYPMSYQKQQSVRPLIGNMEIPYYQRGASMTTRNKRHNCSSRSQHSVDVDRAEISACNYLVSHSSDVEIVNWATNMDAGEERPIYGKRDAMTSEEIAIDVDPLLPSTDWKLTIAISSIVDDTWSSWWASREVWWSVTATTGFTVSFGECNRLLVIMSTCSRKMQPAEGQLIIYPPPRHKLTSRWVMGTGLK